MTRRPEPQHTRDRHHWPERPNEAEQPNPQVNVTDRLAVQVLYGPNGDVIARHDPNPPIGFHK